MDLAWRQPAEGIQEADQLASLKACGCEEGKGTSCPSLLRRTSPKCRGYLGLRTSILAQDTSNRNLENRAEFNRGAFSWSNAMDWNRVEGNWKQVKGTVKQKWGQLTDDDLTAIDGKREQLEGKIQERYGIAKDQARKDVDAWFSAQKW